MRNRVTQTSRLRRQAERRASNRWEYVFRGLDSRTRFLVLRVRRRDRVFSTRFSSRSRSGEIAPQRATPFANKPNVFHTTLDPGYSKLPDRQLIRVNALAQGTIDFCIQIQGNDTVSYFRLQRTFGYNLVITLAFVCSMRSLIATRMWRPFNYLNDVANVQSCSRASHFLLQRRFVYAIVTVFLKFP